MKDDDPFILETDSSVPVHHARRELTGWEAVKFELADEEGAVE